MNPEPACPDDEQSLKGTRDWPHAPPHRLESAGVYFVTARTAGNHNLLQEDSMKDWFQSTLLLLMDEFDWKPEAWAILSNHYHFIAHSQASREGAADSLSRMIRKLHSLTTREINARSSSSDQKRLWQNYRETLLTHQASYLARLHYVHQNAVHHKLVLIGSDWKWCSAAAFKKAVTPAWVKTISSFGYEKIAMKDGDV